MSDSQKIARYEELIQSLRDELETVRGDRVPAHMVAQVTPTAIAEEREAGFVHFHPETFCHLCGRRNLTSWQAPNEVWNAVSDDGRLIEGAGIVCPQCLVERYEARVLGDFTTWGVRPDVMGGESDG